jgi:ketosteroid isomerase-like protein
MKPMLLIAPLLAAASALAPASGGSASAQQQVEAEREIRRLMDDWNNAYLKGDKAAFDRIVADDWVITLSSGKVVEAAKADEMSDLVALDSSYVLRNDEVRVRLLAGDVAVVSRLVTDKGRYLGRDIDRVSRSTDVLAKRKGRWQVVLTHLTRVAPPQPKA